MASQNYYESLYARARDGGAKGPIAFVDVVEAYLDGKPHSKARRLSRAERDELFWSSNLIAECPEPCWESSAMALALTRYIGQDAMIVEGLLTEVAKIAPNTVIFAVRRSGLVLRHGSRHRAELDRAARECAALSEICGVLEMLCEAHRERIAARDEYRRALEHLSAFELLIYASVHAFERLDRHGALEEFVSQLNDSDVQATWDAIGYLLNWKLGSVSPDSLRLTDAQIGHSIAEHLRPILFDPSSSSATRTRENLRAFANLLDAERELDDFTRRSADAFSYDDSIRFERRGALLEIVEVDPAQRKAWRDDGRKLECLHVYWLNRAIDSYVEKVAADPSIWHIGRPENFEPNRVAWLRAIQAQLRLREAFGVADTIAVDSGEHVDLFRALLALNLMSAFYYLEFVVAYSRHRASSRDSASALGRLAFEGIQTGLQNRLPLSWSDRDEKVRNITGWTVTRFEPKGNARMASSILRLWSFDLSEASDRLKRGEPALMPHLIERPILRFGATLVTLPWMLGVENNVSAAINNLRRIGARRADARDETQRIEANLARLFESRGFKVLVNWTPPENGDAGEVDVIASLDSHLFILEVKSTYLRRTQREAWIHATTSLRTAGRQLARKTQAVLRALEDDEHVRAALGIEEKNSPHCVAGWIVDTCIEHDHQQFNGFLKVSVEELLIALRDDRHLLDMPADLLERPSLRRSDDVLRGVPAGSRLYPAGFTAERFSEVIVTAAVWEAVGISK